MPALWPICVEICETENTLFLPQDVSNIVIKLLEIRRSTFANAPMLEDYMIMIIVKYFIEKKIFFYFSDLHHFGGNEYFKDSYFLEDHDHLQLCHCKLFIFVFSILKYLIFFKTSQFWKIQSWSSSIISLKTFYFLFFSFQNLPILKNSIMIIFNNVIANFLFLAFFVFV